MDMAWVRKTLCVDDHNRDLAAPVDRSQRRCRLQIGMILRRGFVDLVQDDVAFRNPWTMSPRLSVDNASSFGVRLVEAS